MASMTLYEPGARPLFIAQAGDGLPLVFLVDGVGRLHLYRAFASGAWQTVDLSAALGGREVRCADIRQAPDGTLVLALAQQNWAGDCTLHVATGIPAALDDAGWLQLLRELPAQPALPAGASVTHLAFGPLQTGAPPLLLISGIVNGEGGTWYCNGAAPEHSLRPLRLPEGLRDARAYAVGSYRQPGVWALRPGIAGNALHFTSFRDPFGWDADVAYPGLPADTRSVLLAPGSMPNVPDLFAAGERIVVYRGGNTAPQAVAQVANARLLWTNANERGEYLAYADADGAMWLIARPRHGAWNAPVLLTRRRAVLTAAGASIHAASVDKAGLTLKRFTHAGKLAARITIALPV